MSQEEAERQPLSSRAFVSLAEALSWIAFEDAMSAEQLNAQLAGIPPQKVESNEHYLRKFFAEEGVPEVDWPGTGHFEDRQQGLEKLDAAWLWLRDAVENQTISVRGRYTQTYSRADAVLADVETLTGAKLATFSQFDVSAGGIQRQTEGTPSVIWSNHPQAYVRGFEAAGDDQRAVDGYLLVEVERAALLRMWPTASIAGNATAKAEQECRTWLSIKFIDDPNKKRTKASFKEEALAHFNGRLSARSFLRAWDAVADEAGRKKPGRKSWRCIDTPIYRVVYLSVHNAANPQTSSNSKRGHVMQTKDDYPPKIGYSIRESCLASSLSRTTIYSHITAGRLRATRVGGRTIIPAESLHALINGRG